MAKTVVKKCKCTSPFQDKTYGNQNRLHNVNADNTKAHCSVCEGGAKNAKRESKLKKPTDAPTTTRAFKPV